MKNIEAILKKYQSFLEYRDLVLLLATVLKKNTAFVYTHPEYRLNFRQYFKLTNCLRRRKNNVPMAYLTKHQEFFGQDFYINKHVLIPRPETEMLVEETLAIIKKSGDQTRPLLLIDVGTGSGCIPITILKNTPDKITAIALDTSAAALQVARKNARQHQVKIAFKKSNLLSKIIQSKIVKNYPIVVITANLPYLTARQFKNEPTIQHEPRRALVAADNGLALYKKMIIQVNILLSDNPQTKFSILMEIDPDQKQPLTEYLQHTLPQWNTETKTDLCGRNRLMIATNW